VLCVAQCKSVGLTRLAVFPYWYSKLSKDKSPPGGAPALAVIGLVGAIVCDATPVNTVKTADAAYSLAKYIMIGHSGV
jgi:hypothetical protein